MPSNIVGWSFSNTTYTFHSFGWNGCDACDGPFPFATGSFMALSAPLARAVLSGIARSGEIRRVHALPPKHTLFFQDAFIGQAVHRLAALKPARLPIHVYSFDELSLDTDGFRVAPSLVLWHNRHKLPCRVTCLADYYNRGHHCSSLPGRNWTWASMRKPHIDPSRYALWTIGGYRRPRGAPHGVTLTGSDAPRNNSCAVTVDLRDGSLVRAFGLDECQGCFDSMHAATKRGRRL